MKLEDCKPGVRVRVYDGHYGESTGNIIEVEGVMVKVGYDSRYGWDQFYAEQLRKIVPKKDRPELTVFFHADGSFGAPLVSSEEAENYKFSGKQVWLMRGVKRL